MNKLILAFVFAVVAVVGCNGETGGSSNVTSSSTGAGGEATSSTAGGGEVGGGGTAQQPLTDCTNRVDGTLCWGELKDRIHGRCLKQECITTEWDCASDTDCNDRNDCTTDICAPATGQCIHGDLPHTATCFASDGVGHCNLVDSSCCVGGFILDEVELDWWICVEACPFGYTQRPIDGLCVHV